MAQKNGTGVISVLLAATSSVRRAALESIIASEPHLKLVGTITALTSLASHARDVQPDVILAELERPDPHFLTTFSTVVTGSAPSAVMLVDDPELAWIARAIRLGVRSILPRDATEEEIVSAIRAVHSGLALLDPEIAQELARHVRLKEAEPTHEPLGDLTPREIEVLRMLADGIANRQMAARLGISEHTVKFHISSILDKLDASSRTEAVTMGIRMGIIAI